MLSVSTIKLLVVIGVQLGCIVLALIAFIRPKPLLFPGELHGASILALVTVAFSGLSLQNGLIVNSLPFPDTACILVDISSPKFRHDYGSREGLASHCGSMGQGANPRRIFEPVATVPVETSATLPEGLTTAEAQIGSYNAYGSLSFLCVAVTQLFLLFLRPE